MTYSPAAGFNIGQLISKILINGIHLDRYQLGKSFRSWFQRARLMSYPGGAHSLSKQTGTASFRFWMVLVAVSWGCCILRLLFLPCDISTQTITDSTSFTFTYIRIVCNPCILFPCFQLSYIDEWGFPWFSALIQMCLLMCHCVLHDLVPGLPGYGLVRAGSFPRPGPGHFSARLKSTDDETSPKSLKISATFASSQLAGMFLTYRFLSWTGSWGTKGNTKGNAMKCFLVWRYLE